MKYTLFYPLLCLALFIFSLSWVLIVTKGKHTAFSYYRLGQGYKM